MFFSQISYQIGAFRDPPFATDLRWLVNLPTNYESWLIGVSSMRAPTSMSKREYR